MTRSLALAGLMALASSAAFAQTPPPAAENVLTTRKGHQLNVSFHHYDYTEPIVDISIHGPKFGAEYTGTFTLNERRHWFAQFNLRGTGAIARYDGNCRPWQITPDSTKTNGYRLTLGTASPCSESGDIDWYADGRALAGKDFVGSAWAISPFTGVGVRHLSNGVTGNYNFRTDEYVYVPLGATLRTKTAGDRTLSVTIEYDHLLRGWQKTRDSLLAGGTVPATSTTPAFSIGDFEDVAFDQHHGWAFRAGASFQVNRRWSIEPYYTRWRVGDSTASNGSVAYTVNGITARQILGYYEPLNLTNEFGVKVGLHFGGR